ncbi:MAG: hypothetical protein L0207_06170 [Chlamydiae bacterium]|nr:hypothetical protein [Chlamydiota bacterium]
MENKELNNKVANLESKLDLVESELSYLNKILVECGFPEGIQTLKQTVEDLLSQEVEGLSEKFKTFEF